MFYYINGPARGWGSLAPGQTTSTLNPCTSRKHISCGFPESTCVLNLVCACVIFNMLAVECFNTVFLRLKWLRFNKKFFFSDAQMRATRASTGITCEKNYVAFSHVARSRGSPGNTPSVRVGLAVSTICESIQMFIKFSFIQNLTHSCR